MAAVTSWRMVVVPWLLPVTVTVFGVFQSALPKLTAAPTVALAFPAAGVIVTVPPGSLFRRSA